MHFIQCKAKAAICTWLCSTQMLHIRMKHSHGCLEVNYRRCAVIRQIPTCKSQRTCPRRGCSSRFFVAAGYWLGVIDTGEIIIAGQLKNIYWMSSGENKHSRISRNSEGMFASIKMKCAFLIYMFEENDALFQTGY